MRTFSELLNRSFEKANFGGYKASDVDNFMEELASMATQFDRETNELKQKLRAAEMRIKDFENDEESLKTALLSAQKLADSIVREANEKAQITLKDAEIKAQDTVSKAEAEAQSMISEAEAKVQSMISEAKAKAQGMIDSVQDEIRFRKNEAERIKNEVSDFKLNVMRLYKAQLELIKDIPEQNLQNAGVYEEISAQSVQTDDESNPITEPDLEFSESEAAAVHEEPVEEARIESEPAFEDKTEPEEIEEYSDTANPDEQTVLAESAEMSEQPQPEQTGEERTDEQINAQQDFILDPLESQNEADEPDAPKKHTVKLNLRYNEKTGEYEPIDKTIGEIENDNGDGIKFGADYNIRTDSFDSESGHIWGRRR
jgi:cell division initiation protein